MTKYVPTRTKKKATHNPWINRNIIHLKRKISRCRAQIRRTATPSAREKIRSLSQNLKTSIKDAKHRYFNQTMPAFLISSPRKFWQHLSPTKEGVEKLDVDRHTIEDNYEIANCFNTFFSTVFSSDDGTTPVFNQFEDVTSIPDVQLSWEGIVDLLHHLDSKKATGYDKIPNAFLQRYAESLSHYIIIIFERSLSSSSLPNDCKVGKVVPVLKSGKATSVNNYRPISLTPTCGKLLEHILSSHIHSFLSHYNLLNSSQHGFRKGVSTITQLVEVTHDFSEVLNRKGQVDVIFFRFKKSI